MIIKLDDSDKRLLNNIGISRGVYSAEGDTDFIFPSEKEDFNIRIFEENGELFAEFPDSIEPAYEGKTLDLTAGEDHSQTLAGKVVAIYV